jgi:hypothetical protein
MQARSLPLKRGVKLLRSRPTEYFLFLLVQCRCGKRFGHRADRQVVACFKCGRTGTLDALRKKATESAPPLRRRPSVPASRTPARHVLRATLARRRRRVHR